MYYDYVKRAAQGKWDVLLQQLAGLSKPETTPGKKGMPCPHCGGTDRYEFKSVENGFYMCRGCGAGDGWSMLQKRLGVDFMGAVRQVAQHLGISHNTSVNTLALPEKKQTSVVELDQRRYDSVATKAAYIWNHATPEPVDHPYLLKKKLPPLKLRLHRDCLVSQLFDQQHRLVNLQFIDPDGNKRFLRGGQVKGCFQWWLPFSGPSWSIYLCEGVADALSTYLHLKKLRIVVCSYSVSNMIDIASWLRQIKPENRLIAVIDNDKPKKQRRWNPGVAVLHAHHLFHDIILPPRGMDASDLWVNHHD